MIMFGIGNMLISRRLMTKHQAIHIDFEDLACKVDDYCDYCMENKALPTYEGLAAHFGVPSSALRKHFDTNEDTRTVRDHFLDRVIDITVNLGSSGYSSAVLLAHMKRHCAEYKESYDINLNKSTQLGIFLNANLTSLSANDLKAIGDLARKELDDYERQERIINAAGESRLLGSKELLPVTTGETD